ncbi:MAG: FAD-binding molybdopterin dehydrogenase, partial [Nakamurella sp.]
MDLNTVTGYRRAVIRDDLVLAPGEQILGGGTWLFSEPQLRTTGLV